MNYQLIDLHASSGTTVQLPSQQSGYMGTEMITYECACV